MLQEMRGTFLEVLASIDQGILEANTSIWGKELIFEYFS